MLRKTSNHRTKKKRKYSLSYSFLIHFLSDSTQVIGILSIPIPLDVSVSNLSIPPLLTLFFIFNSESRVTY